MSHQRRQNLLFTLFTTALGMMINIFHTVADRMALSLGRQAADAGMLISIYALGSLTSVVLSSSLADRVGKRRVIATATVVMTAGFAMLYLSHRFWPLALGLFLFGVGFGPAEGMSSAVLSDENPLTSAKWVNLAHAGFGLGAILGPMLAVASLSLSGSHHQIFLLCAAVALVFLALIMPGALKKPVLSPDLSAQGSPLQMFSVLKSRRFVYLSLMMFLYLGYESVASAYSKQLFLQQGHSEALAAGMISLFWGSMIVGRLLGAAFQGRELLSIRGFGAIAFAGILLLNFAPSLPLRILAVAMYGFGCGPTWPMLVVLATRMYPGRSGAAMGMMMISTMAGLTVFPFLIGTLPNNLTVTFLSAAGLVALLVLLSVMAGREKETAA